MKTKPQSILTVSDQQYWEQLYQIGKTPWELNTYSPPLKTFLDSPYAVKPGAIAVLGCGTGHDCMLFANYGFTVIAVDFAPSAVKSTAEKFQSAGILGKTGFLLERDIFSLYEYSPRLSSDIKIAPQVAFFKLRIRLLYVSSSSVGLLGLGNCFMMNK